MNNCYKSSIQCTPFQLIYGRNPKTPTSAHLQNVKEENPSALLSAKDMHERLDRAKQCMLAAQNRDKAYADKRSRPQKFEVGQRVLLSTKNLHFKKTDLSKKLISRFIGPFKVLKTVGPRQRPLAYELYSS